MLLCSIRYFAQKEEAPFPGASSRKATTCSKQTLEIVFLIVVVLIVVLVVFVLIVILAAGASGICVVVEFVVLIIVLVVIRHFKFLLDVFSYTISMSFFTKTMQNFCEHLVLFLTCNLKKYHV